MVFTAVGVDAQKAVKLWRHGVRSTSRLASLSAWEEEMAGIVNIDKERLHQFLEARPLGHRSRSLPLRSDHPIISPTLRGTRVGAKLALRSPAGRAAALEEIDILSGKFLYSYIKKRGNRRLFCVPFREHCEEDRSSGVDGCLPSHFLNTAKVSPLTVRATFTGPGSFLLLLK